MFDHLSDEQLINYVNHLLTNTQREIIDLHLSRCPECRALLAEHEALHRRIRYSLMARRRQVKPSTQMSFAAIAPGLKHSRRVAMIARLSNQLLYSMATIVILVALGIGLFIFYNNPSPPALPATITAPDGATMALIPAGPFEMGSASGDIDEQPVHTVILDDFYIDQYEVSNARYRQCVEAGICESPMTCGWGVSTYEDPAKANYPVGCTNWFDAKTYCEWRGGRLPTEAEWEKAARGTDGRTYPWGEQDPDLLPNLEKYRGPYQPVQVDSFPDNVSPYGVYNMAGNVWEWVSDWYDEEYYAKSPAQNPQGPDDGFSKVIRGGGWPQQARDFRAAGREYADPTEQSSDHGFRCVATEPE
jgi:formylglycine-generating enzyme required for sulfatase activity